MPPFSILGFSGATAHHLPLLRHVEPQLRPYIDKCVVTKVVCDYEPGLPEEAAWLGLDPVTVPLQPGPLQVAAVRYSPPAGSVHFVLTPMSVGEDGTLSRLRSAQLATVREGLSVVSRLATKTLTPLIGPFTDHAMVWEPGSLDIDCHMPADAEGRAWSSALPIGDHDTVLRQFVEDSLDLLDGQEWNRIRGEEGEPKVNVMWPWGQGFRQSVPNLTVQRGYSLSVADPPVRLAGLARLTGSLVTPTSMTGRQHVLRVDSLLQDFGVPGEPSEEMIERFAPVFASRLQPLLAAAPSRWHLILPGKPGLALSYDPEALPTNRLPFDDRVLDDPRVKSVQLHEFMRAALS